MRFHLKYAGISLLIFGVEVLIALFLDDKLIRPFFGDLLVVMLIYFTLLTFIKISRRHVLATGVWLFALIIEYLQYLDIVSALGLRENEIVRIVLGSTFDWFDIMAYTFGALIALFCDWNFFDEAEKVKN